MKDQKFQTQKYRILIDLGKKIIGRAPCTLEHGVPSWKVKHTTCTKQQPLPSSRANVRPCNPLETESLKFPLADSNTNVTIHTSVFLLKKLTEKIYHKRLNL